MERELISVTIVTYNSEQDIGRCLDSLTLQTHQDLEVIVVDNASSDRSVEVVEAHPIQKTLLRNETNVGFTGGQNRAIGAASGGWILVLNPDIILAPDYLEQALRVSATAGSTHRAGGARMAPGPQKAAEAGAAHAGRNTDHLGTVAGKLLRTPDPLPEITSASRGSDQCFDDQVIDSTGIRMTLSCRHLDRGAGEPDRGQYDTPGPVFGATGAAALYRREMVEDVTIDGQFFDEDFFSFREDADLAWRCQLLGWDTLYCPAAVAFHRRRVTPERRTSLPPEINLHSVKNRYLLRLKNQTLSNFARCLVPSLWRDLLVLGALMTVERSSLPAVGYIRRHRSRFLKKRHEIMTRKRRPSREINAWFTW